MGKTIAMYLWPLLKLGLQRQPDGQPARPLCPSEPGLLIASGDLHEQIIAEGQNHFGITPTLLDSQETFSKLASLCPSTGRWILPPGYYLSTYTQIARNGVTPFPELDSLNPERMLERLNLGRTEVQEFFDGRQERYEKHYRGLGATALDSLPELRAKWQQERKWAERDSYRQQELDDSFNLLANFAPKRSLPLPDFNDLDAKQQAGVTALFVAMAHKALSTNLGESRRSIKCVFSPTLADLCAHSFACVVCDEGVKLKGEETIVGKGIRQLSPRFRLILTATPIKNRLPDVFRLAHWATGANLEATPRFPYGDDDAEEFAEDFAVTERNLSAEAQAKARGERKRFVKKTAHVCNIHLLWKLFAPIILRRRKNNCGEDIVPMHRRVIRVPMGAEQTAVYKYHLEGEYLDKNDKPAIGAKLQALRMVASAPNSLLLKPVRQNRWQAQPTFRSSYPITPKLLAAVRLVRDILDRHEQVVIFSALHDPTDNLAARLREAGVNFRVMDGRQSPALRGEISRAFKSQAFPVLLCGAESCAEGHSWPQANNVILVAYSWALDKLLQSISRVHRLISPRAVNLYNIVVEGSIDCKLESMLAEKGDAAELVLDGHLMGQDPEEVNLAELLHIAERDFASLKAAGLDEKDLAREWPPLCAQLSQAARGWTAREVSKAEPPRVEVPIMEVPIVEEVLPVIPLWRQRLIRRASQPRPATRLLTSSVQPAGAFGLRIGSIGCPDRL